MPINDDQPSLFNASDSSLLSEQGDFVSSALHRLHGDVLRIVYVNQENNYAVLRLNDDNGNQQTLVGALGGVLEGQTIEAEGRWESHKEHGRQFRVTNYRAVLPSSAEGITKYLSSGVLPGIGEVFAKRIVDHFGLDTLNVLDTCSERLKEVPGIGKKRIDEIREAWTERSAKRETEVFLQGIGLSPAYCRRVEEVYGATSAEVVRRNPYQLAADVDGIGFLSADHIAAKLGIAPDSPLRLCAGIVYTLEEFATQGHVCVTRQQLLDSAKLRLNVSLDALELGLREALAQGRVVRDVSHLNGGTEMYFQRNLCIAERELAASVNVLLAQGATGKQLPDGLGDGFQRLNAAQRMAVERAFSAGFSIVTGGPGVGKTTVVGQMVAVADKLHWRLLLAAPTGRASKRLSEATGKEAQTIHRLLKWDPAVHAFQHDEDNPLDCQMLIIDEVSMLDTQLASNLFRAVRGGTHVVLVGDKDQLPSVGPGAVLHDLIVSQRIPVTELTEIYRQASGSRIITNSHAVNRGHMPDCRPLGPGILADFYWVELDDPVRAADMIVKMVVERIPKVYGYDPMTDVQILSPMRKGECGTLIMNDRLQQALNPPGEGKDDFYSGTRRFRTGDRVMQIKNNYDKGVFNGEMGRLLFIDNTARKFTVQFETTAVEYDQTDCDQLVLAYAVTVHKSQGSEFPVVLMPVQNQHFIMLQRNLIYTGMTRAKKLLIMVGSTKALGIAVRNDKPLQRQTMLVERLQRT